MGRPSVREQRRAEIVTAFARVLANVGYEGATMTAIAAEAGVAPGLLHHHFENKHELLEELLRTLMERFRRRLQSAGGAGSSVVDYTNAALKLDANADVMAARCWVGILAQAVREPALFERVRGLLDAQVSDLQRRAKGALSTSDASALVAFILGALVFGSFLPRRASGFAAPAAEKLFRSLAADRQSGSR